MPTFNEIKQQKYNTPPWDRADNPMGFPAIATIDHNNISAHLPLLEYFASKCDLVTEFGIRRGFSTVAFLSAAKQRLISYDILNNCPIKKELKDVELPCKWEYICADTTTLADIDTTDFLFLDSGHTYQQVKAELRFHNKVKKWIGFHDTYSHGKISRDRATLGQEGIIRAIEEFLVEHPEWKKVYQVDFNHGLIILEKQL